MTMPPVDLHLDVDELVDVAQRVSTFCDDDEGWPLGHVLLTSHAGRRRWIGGSSNVYVMLDTVEGGPMPKALLSPRLLPMPSLVSELEVDSVRLSLPAPDEDGLCTGAVELTVGPMRVVQPAGVGFYPDVTDTLHTDKHARARTSTVALLAVVEQIRTVPGGLELGPDYPPPLAWFIAEPGRVGVRVDWPGVGRAEAFVDAEVEGAARMTVPLGLLERLLQTATDPEIELFLPIQEASWLVMRQAGWTGGVARFRPFPTTSELQTRLQLWLEDDFGQGDAGPDDDGDLPMRFEEQRLFLRVADGEPPVVQVFAVLGEGEEDDGLLLNTINGLNADVRHARVFITGGQILVETDLGHDLSVADLREGARRIADLARMLPGVLAIRQQRLL
ncbi:hypothetical protein DVS28_a0881 [Euzebya pacifica]|uniref:TY-Chap central domain-containing protein n=2 Tax=Euzebya pacifica TaxID=1608957 RepID=A0A346XTN5_9ACTN|nr:hypothetical protein DVS28_a0881 [Euzebya pacifica]